MSPHNHFQNLCLYPHTPAGRPVGVSQESSSTSRGRCDGRALWGWCEVTWTGASRAEDGARRGGCCSSRHLRAERPVRAHLVSGDTAPVRPLKCRNKFPSGGFKRPSDWMTSELKELGVELRSSFPSTAGVSLAFISKLCVLICITATSTSTQNHCDGPLPLTHTRTHKHVTRSEDERKDRKQETETWNLSLNLIRSFHEFSMNQLCKLLKQVWFCLFSVFVHPVDWI